LFISNDVTMTSAWRTSDVESVLTNDSQVSVNTADVQPGVAANYTTHSQ